MSNPTRPIGTLESMAICAGIAALAGAGSAILLMIVADWSILQGIFAGFVVFVVLMPILMVTMRRPSSDVGASGGELETRDVVAEARKPNLRPRNLNAPSPHRDSIDFSPISDPRHDNMESPRVNKALGGEAATTGIVGASAAAATPTPSPAPEPTPAPAAVAEEPVAAPAEPAPAPEPTPAPAAAASVSGADVPAGQEKKPETLAAARDGKADDLKMIKGVGPKLEKLCNELGFYHFDQIANWTAEEVAWVDQNLTGFKGRVTRDDWVAQARILAAGGETEFSKKVDEGGVY